MCSAYIDFYSGQAPDAPSLVRELRLDRSCFNLDEVHRAPEIIPLLKELRSLRLRGFILPSGTLCASRIHSLSLRGGFFSGRLQLDRFFSSMPALKSLSLAGDLNIDTTLDLRSDSAPLLGPAIEVLRLRNVRETQFFDRVLNHGLPCSIRNIRCLDVDCADNHLEEFISRVLQSRSHIEELSIKRPKASFGEDEYDDEEEEEEDEDEDEDEEDEDAVTSDEESIPNDDIGHEPNVATAGDGETHVSNGGTSSSLPHTLRLDLLQFDMTDHEGDGTDYADDDRDPRSVLRWLIRQFRKNLPSFSIGTVRINISLRGDDFNACVDSSLWRDWDVELSRCLGGSPNVFVTLRFFVAEEQEETIDEVDDYVARIKKSLDRIGRCIVNNMQNVRTAQRLHLSSVIERPYQEKVRNVFTRMTPKEMRRYLWLEAGMDIEDLKDPY
ncbi:hypothetical protein BDZ89DRAFT_1073037 [Hymenopellis radicata]|nr:hypothetical protein BDZ89DRAFT_1073037 [Hymenopellis radicata]